MLNDISELQLGQIAEIAKELHATQKRKDGSPYFAHLERVAFACKKYNSNLVCAIAYLHDALEDKRASRDELENHLNYVVNKDIVKIIVDCCEILDKTFKTNEEYMTEICGNKFCKLVKMCDICDNLTDKPSEKSKEKYLTNLRYLTN